MEVPYSTAYNPAVWLQKLLEGEIAMSIFGWVLAVLGVHMAKSACDVWHEMFGKKKGGRRL